jgi:hypothetical protein
MFFVGEGAVACLPLGTQLQVSPSAAITCLQSMSSIRLQLIGVLSWEGDNCISVIRHATASVAPDCNCMSMLGNGAENKKKLPYDHPGTI